jgi:AraC family transcriptional regulator
MSKDLKNTTRASHQQRILRVLSYIKKHLDEPLDLNQLAALAYFSPHHFHRIFTELVGESVKEHVRRLKLQRALFLLATTDQSVTDIAFSAGFSTPEAFSRVIKSKFGFSPSGARKGMRSDLYLGDDNDQISVSIITMPALDLAFIRHIGCYEDAATAWLKLVVETSLSDVMESDQMRIGFAYDHPDITPPDKCCYDACIVWQDHYKEHGELGRMQVPEGRYAMFTHVGTLETIDQSYQKFARQWMSGHDVNFNDRHNFMWYKNTAMMTNPTEQITECYFPIQ